MATEPNHQSDSHPGPKTGTATRERGRAQVKKIMREAQSVLIQEGYAGLTVRKVARNLDISLGNLTYYFPTKEQLLRALVTDLLATYHDALLEEQDRFPDDPERRVRAYLQFLLTDCRNPETRATFFQIWGLATHNEAIHQLRDEIYAAFKSDATELLRPLAINLPEEELNDRIGIVVGMIEGLHVTLDLNDDVLGLTDNFDSVFIDAVLGLVSK